MTEYLKIIITTISDNFQALLIFIGILIFRIPIFNLFERGFRFSRNPEMTQLEIDTRTKIDELNRKGEEVAEYLIDTGEKVKYLLHQGKPYRDYKMAFKDALNFIENSMQQRYDVKTDEPVDVKLISVAMKISWNELIMFIPTLMNRYDGVHVRIEALFVDPKYLKNLLNQNGQNWAKESSSRFKQFSSFASKYGDFDGRLNFSIRTYKNLPHWHGILIENQRLFLGRANWSFNKGKPMLNAEVNKYRYFSSINDGANEGKERILLFKNWHRYYSSDSAWVEAQTIRGKSIIDDRRAK